MLAQIHKEHENIVRLLKVLEAKLEAIRQEKSVRYKLIRDIIEYMQEYADRYHHPKEDLIYEYYLEHHPVAKEVAARLSTEHKRLYQDTQDLKDTVDMILMDAVVPLDQFCFRLEAYIRCQFQHLNYEEDEILPMLAKELTEEDWKVLEMNWRHLEQEDPLFGRVVAEQYQDLADRINRIH